VIRRLFVATLVASFSLTTFAAGAGAANGDVLCAYVRDPLDQGICISV
jgi:hypothetical protein